MTPALWMLVGALALCVALSAFFSSSETAFSAANRVKLKTMAQDGNRRAALTLRMADDYDRLLTTILVGNNVVNIAGTSIATVLFTFFYGSMGATVSTIVMTLLVLLFGEISPKTLAKESPEKVAMAVAPVLNALTHLLLPVNLLFAQWRKLLSVLFKPAEDLSHIEDELITMVDEAQEDGDMDAHEGELIRSAIEFREQDVKAIMTPRVDMTAIEDTATMEEAANVFRTTAYSRIPVYHEDTDHIVGILHEKDFNVSRYEGRCDIAAIMQPPVYAPASLSVSKLLKLFQSSKTHMVVVLDEFGGTEGIVTMEDVLEELVGEIYDEHDDISEDCVPLSDGSMMVDGSMQLSELLEQLDIEDTFLAETVGGFAGEVLGRIPTVGASFEVSGIRCVVTEMERRRVTRVRITRIPQENAEESSAVPFARKNKQEDESHG